MYVNKTSEAIQQNELELSSPPRENKKIHKSWDIFRLTGARKGTKAGNKDNWTEGEGDELMGKKT